MSAKSVMATGAKAAQTGTAELLKQYGCGPVQFSGTDGLYERHLQFDNVVDERKIGPRERFEAAARSVRDVLSQRWALTENTLNARTRSASTTSPWSSFWAARWPTT
jgi:starch phosphorylase